MNYIHIPFSHQASNKWSGGTTTELYIYPESANYKALNFDFRISTATVEVDESTFTPLKDINRKLMVLEGKTTLYHLNEHSKELNKFDVDTFSGNWQTKSIGKCRDFNLMTAKSCNGNIEAISFNGAQIIETQKCNSIILFINFGELAITSDNKEIISNTFDTIIIQKPNNDLLLKSNNKSEVIIARIFT